MTTMRPPCPPRHATRLATGLVFALSAVVLTACSDGSQSGGRAHYVSVGPIGAPDSSSGSGPASAGATTSGPAGPSSTGSAPGTTIPSTSEPATKTSESATRKTSESATSSSATSTPTQTATSQSAATSAPATSAPATSDTIYADIAGATRALQSLGASGHLTVAPVPGGYDAAATADDGYVQLWSERDGQPWRKDVTTTYIGQPNGSALQYPPRGATLLVPDGAPYPIFGIEATLDSGHHAGDPMFADIAGSWKMLVRNEHGDLVGVDASVGVAGLNGNYPYLFDAASVEAGKLVTQVYPSVLSYAVQGGFPVIQYWKPSEQGYQVTGDNIMIAKAATSAIGELTDLAPYLPDSGLPDGTYGADFQGMSENSDDHVTIQPIAAAGSNSYYDTGAPQSVPVASGVDFRIPVLTGQSSSWSFITAPVWITEVLDAPDVAGPGIFGNDYRSPYYIPAKLGVTRIGKIVGAARVTVTSGTVTAVTIMPGQ